MSLQSPATPLVGMVAHTASGLPWQKLGFGHYRAEPRPGIVYRIYPAEVPEAGFIFEVPGYAPAPAMRSSVARSACEHHWATRLAPTFRNT